MILWRHHLSSNTKKGDNGGRGSQKIAWRHLWTTTIDICRLFEHQKCVFLIRFFRKMYFNIDSISITLDVFKTNVWKKKKKKYKKLHFFYLLPLTRRRSERERERESGNTNQRSQGCLKMQQKSLQSEWMQKKQQGMPFLNNIFEKEEKKIGNTNFVIQFNLSRFEAWNIQRKPNNVEEWFLNSWKKSTVHFSSWKWNPKNRSSKMSRIVAF